jgi:phosphoserine aminotransferase
VGDNKEEVLKRLRKVVDEELKLDYLVTGSWSLKASQEAARLIGTKHVNVAVDARKANDGKFGKIPSEDQWNLTPRSSGGPAFVYFCDNETVDGVEFPSFPKSLEGEDAPIVVADMSSNFISRKVDVKKYGIIFGGAQKNIGNTGIAIAILRNSLLPPQSPYASPDLLRELNLAVGPIVLDYPTIAKNNSLYNTLPIFDVWVAGQVMKGLVDSYGAKRIGGQEEISDEKANLIYGVLDNYPEVYRVVPDKSVRSRMNICFRVAGGDADKEKEFLTGAEKKGLLGLKGHRSVGGIRASNCEYHLHHTLGCHRANMTSLQTTLSPWTARSYSPLTLKSTLSPHKKLSAMTRKAFSSRSPKSSPLIFCRKQYLQDTCSYNE